MSEEKKTTPSTNIPLLSLRTIILSILDEDPCANKTDCPEQSTCEVDEEGEAECVCLEGFTGPDCDVAEDMCDPENGGDELCTHEGAQCVSDPEGGFSCECKDGYEGHGLNCVGKCRVDSLEIAFAVIHYFITMSTKTFLSLFYHVFFRKEFLFAIFKVNDVFIA